MTKNTELTKAQIDTMVAEFDSKIKNPFLKVEKDNAAAIKDLDNKTADRCYGVIAGLADLALSLGIDKDDVTDAYKQFLLDRSLAPARGTNNRYLPFVKAVFSEKTDGKWTFTDRSREKYANVLRHLIAQKASGQLRGTIQDYIRNYNVKPYGVAMKGIEAQDRADNPSKGAAERVESLRQKGRDAKAIASIPNRFGVAANKVVVLYGHANNNGEVDILSTTELEDEEAEGFYYRLGLSLTPKKAA